MLKIAIGTNSTYKVHAIKSALYNLDFEFESAFDKVESEVSEQPMRVGETKLGSINRAKNILSKHPEYDLGIGVEFGYEPIDGKYHMVCWGSIYTKNGEIYSEQSSTLEVPKLSTQALLNEDSLEDAIMQEIAKLDDIHTNRIFKEFIKKRKVINECVTNVMLRYLLREIY